MNKFNTILSLFAVAVIVFLAAGSQTNNTPEFLFNSETKFAANELISSKDAGSFKKVDLFSLTDSYLYEALQFADDAVMFNLNASELAKLYKEAPESITLDLPASNGVEKIKLTKVNILSPDFEIYAKTTSGRREVPYTPGIYYRGIIFGKQSSIASLSVFENEVRGIFSDERGNFVLGAKDGDASSYIYYNDINMNVENDFKCAVDGRESEFTRYGSLSSSKGTGDNPGVRNPIRVYFEADHQMYLDNGSNITAVGNEITSFYNSVATIYAQENIPIEISEIAAWTQQDPYALTNQSDEILFDFGDNNQDEFDGNLAHLLSTRNEGMGGIAWINILCAPYEAQFRAGRFAFSNIEDGHQPFPTYSWTVHVVAHEMGHNVGSQHTHWCGWPVGPGGQLGPIDQCYFAEGGCFTGRNPMANGTVMSYCHIGGSVNLALGFGPLPGDTVSFRYNQAPCLEGYLNSSEAPATFDMSQNYPNPFNPSTSINFALPVDAIVSLKIYDMSGKEVASLINDRQFNAGFFTQQFNTMNYNLTSGVYFYRILARDAATGAAVFTKVNKMVLVK